MRKGMTLLERMIRIELLLENHLKSHERILKWVLCPILVGVILTSVKVYLLK